MQLLRPFEILNQSTSYDVRCHVKGGGHTGQVGAIVHGISKDSIEIHLKFKKKYKLKFDLLSDEKKEVIKKYGVWGKKSFLGKEFMGVIRTTFLINSKGKIHKIWNNVRVKDHAKEVFEEAKSLK